MPRIASITLLCILAGCSAVRPNAAPGVLAGASARTVPASATGAKATKYICEDGTQFSIRFDGSRASVERAGQPTIMLERQKSGSGIRYALGPYEFRGHGQQATWSIGDPTPTDCRAL